VKSGWWVYDPKIRWYGNSADIAQDVNKPNPVEVRRRDVHVFDQRTASILDAVLPSQPGDNLNVYIFIPDTFDREAAVSYASLDALWLLLSLGKLIEVALLWRGGAILLAQITFSCWLFFFISSIVLAVHEVFLGDNNLASKSGIDIVGGSLPSSSTPGGGRTVILGSRGGHAFFLSGGLCGLLVPSSPSVHYLDVHRAFASEECRGFLTWTISQLVWLALKSTLFHIVDDRERPYHANLQGQQWSKLGLQEKARVRGLLFPLAKYQRHIHLRQYRSYSEET
jgi:hypothetical protein